MKEKAPVPDSKMAARVVVLYEPCRETSEQERLRTMNYRILTWTIPFLLEEKMINAFCKVFPRTQVNGPGPDGSWAFTIKDCDLSDKRLMNKCQSIFRRYLRKVKIEEGNEEEKL